MNLHQAYKILGIDETASFYEVKQAFRFLASMWHPDKHTQNESVLEKSHRKMKEINAAYTLLQSHYQKSGSSPKRSNGDDGRSSTIIICKSCGTNNRIHNYKNGTFKCGKCKSFLFSEKASTANEERLLCADGMCTGMVIKGRCDVCGKTLEEGRKENELRNKANYTHRQKTHRKKKKEKIIKIVSVVSLVVFISILMINESNRVEVNNKINKSTQAQEVLFNGPKNDFIIDIKNETLRSAYKKEDIKNLQNRLTKLGYNIGEIDGLIGPNFIKGLNDFSADFSFFKTTKSTSDHLKLSEINSLLSTHAMIAEKHRDWRTIVRENKLNNWYLQQDAVFKKEIFSALKSNDPNIINIVLSFYYFDKASPPQLPIPDNGIYWKSFYEGVAPLHIITRDNGQHHFIKIIKSNTGKTVLKAFVHGGQSVELDIPLGSYIVKYAVGGKWYGEQFLFGPLTSYGKADKAFEFKRFGDQVRGYTLELFKQPDGNLRTSKLSAFEF